LSGRKKSLPTHNRNLCAYKLSLLDRVLYLSACKESLRARKYIL